MEIVASVVDFGTAPEISVDGVARLELISPNKVRVSFFSRHRMWCGKIENRIVAHVDWDRDVWLANFEMFAAKVRDIQNGIGAESSDNQVSAQTH